MLTQGGVGTFDYEAQVDGAATIGLDLPRAQVSDALRSLVVRDDRGSVVSIEVPSDDVADSAFADLPIPRGALDRPIDLLNALRGVEVTIAGPTPITGRLLHAEPPADAVPSATGGAPLALPGGTRVTVLGELGLQQFVLEDVAAVQVTDPGLRARLSAALEAQRGAAATDRRRLSIRVEGAAPRTVRVSMVVAAPLWKAAYRLVLPEPGQDRARLQGWGVLENAGLSDWRDVALTLQAGNPVAFHQDIYASYPVARPEVPVDFRALPVPLADEGAQPVPAAEAAAEPAPPAAPAPMAALAPRAASLASAKMAPPATEAAMAGSEIATAFVLPNRLSLAPGHSAAVPFLDRPLPARRIGLLASFARHPLAAVELLNDTGGGLPPGAVTTLDAEAFAGDVRLAAWPAGERRVLGYAQDNRVTADWQAGTSSTLTGVTAARGVLTLTRRQRRTTTVTLTLATGEPRSVLVEVPREPETTLTVEPDGLAAAQEAAAWRVDVPLVAGQARRVVAHADRLLSRGVTLTDDSSDLVALLGEQALPEAARKALGHVAELRATASDRARDAERVKAERDDVLAEETRIRDNLGALGPNDTLRGRLVRDLDAAETKLATIAGRIDSATQEARAAQDALAAAIANLSF